MSVTLIETLCGMAARSRAVPAGQDLFRRGDKVGNLFVVLQGQVDLIRHSADGVPIVLQRADVGDVVAEASLFSDAYHCDARSDAGASLAVISRNSFRKRLRNDPDFGDMWARHLAREIQNLRFQCEVLSLRTVAARLSTWTEWHGEMPPKGEWKQLAHQLGVSPEALYREMAKRSGAPTLQRDPGGAR
ncbi:MAG: Crp/Fnr family transcriptional regulator [Alphaproteobacteria bacterium]|nr:Crp/Fnr family transcriptional regulator [Alphaproteobacteria bacterium]